MQALSPLDRRFSAAAGRQRRSVALLTDMAFWEPTFGSHARVTSLVRALDTLFDVTCLAFRPVGRDAMRRFAELGVDARLVSAEDWKAGTAAPVKPRLSGLWPLKGRAKPEWMQAAANFLSTHQPDFVVIEYIDRSFLLDAVPEGTITILDAIDVMSERTVSFARAGKSPSIPMPARAEATILSHYDAVMAISPHDADAMRGALGLCNVLHVPQSAVVADAPPLRAEARRILFTGANTEANVTGIRWFLSQVWPLLRGRLELHVVGTVGQSVPEGTPGVVRHGVVADLEAAHHACDIAINPVFLGGGIKIKTLDAMSYGLPCVTTPEGARGLEEAVGTGLLVAGQRLEFAALLLELAGSEARRRAVSAAAQDHVRRRHYPSVAFRDLVRFMNRA